MGRQITRDQAAVIAGVAPDTFSGYVSRGQAPSPVRHVGRTPLWDEAKVKAWAGNRPGRGARGTARARRRAAERTSPTSDQTFESDR
jgi:hypothetical protein